MVKWFISHIKWPSIFLVTAAVMYASTAFAQQYPGFSDQIVNELNTAQSANYLSDDEKEVVLLINLIRHNGTAFWEHLAKPYIRAEAIAESRYTRSLEKDLKAAEKLDQVHPDQTLYNAAKKHAVASGKEGALGHTSSAGTFEQRLKPLIGTFNLLLENSDYGSSKAMDIVMNLMIDEGIPDVGHRKNIMHDKINAVGVSIAPHKTYRHTCVQVFGEKVK